MPKGKGKSANINKNYPMFGWRLQKKHAEELQRQFEAVERLWNRATGAPTSGYKRNDLFYKAMEAGLKYLKENPPE